LIGILKILAPIVGIAALIGALYCQHLTIKNKEAALATALQDQQTLTATLEAYRISFAGQVQTLGEEKRLEIRRNENLLLQLNLIGELDEKDNPDLSDAVLRHFDRLYNNP
jgi:hypothetical protein